MDHQAITKPIQAVGIDLGTTFSALALVGNDGLAQAIPNAEGSLTTPSVAIWHEGVFVVGQPALDLVQHAPPSERDRMTAALIRGVKRMISYPPSGGLSLAGHRTDPIEVSAAILAKLARDASVRLGKVHDAVITVPAHFGDRERNATKTAAEMAGLRILQIMNEPSAAALAYSRGQQVESGLTLVFDLGGGTFDATILQLGATGSRVIATQGIEELGGINFTNNLANDLQRRYEAATGTSYPADNISNDLLVVAAERAKCALSEAQITTVQLALSAGPATDLQVTRKQFERLIKLYVLQLQTAVEMALERARKTPDEINRVLLCGGSSRIPVVQEMLTTLFERPPEHILDLDLSVALGASYLAASCERAEQARPQNAGLQLMDNALIIDCVSYPVGIAALNARGDRLVKLVMLRPGDPLDTWSSPFAVRIAGAATNFPPIAVYKGEGEEIDPNDYLGDITVALPPGIPPGARATVKMLQDQSGLVQIQIVIEEKELPGHLQRA